MLKIKLRHNNVYLRGQCLMCGTTFVWGMVMAEAFEQDGNLAGDVCERCLESGLDAMLNGLRKQACELRERADGLDQLAAEEIEVPSVGDLVDMETSHPWFDGMTPEQIAGYSKGDHIPF